MAKQQPVGRVLLAEGPTGQERGFKIVVKSYACVRSSSALFIEMSLGPVPVKGSIKSIRWICKTKTAGHHQEMELPAVVVVEGARQTEIRLG